VAPVAPVELFPGIPGNPGRPTNPGKSRLRGPNFTILWNKEIINSNSFYGGILGRHNTRESY
jgi:hypothetical protein